MNNHYLTTALSNTQKVIQDMPDYHSINSKAEKLIDNQQCILLSQSRDVFEFLVSDETSNHIARLTAEKEDSINESYKIISPNGDDIWDEYSLASLSILTAELTKGKLTDHEDHRKYTRKGMIERVLKERKDKALHDEYRISLADNIYGDHTVYNNKGTKYKVFLL